MTSDRSNFEFASVPDVAPGEPANGSRIVCDRAGLMPHETKVRMQNSSTSPEWDEAQALANLCAKFVELTGHGYSLRMAATQLGKSPSFFSGKDCMLARWQSGGVEALLKKRAATGAPAQDLSAQIESLDWFIPAGNFFYLLSNRTWKSGSMPEAIRRVISLPLVPIGWQKEITRRFLKSINRDDLPVCPPELREAILAREKRGLPLVPDRIARKVRLNPRIVRQYRNPREASLDLLSAPGGMRIFQDGTDHGRLAQAGEIIECDDATINFPVCVPWTMGADACSQKYGVLVARFQWLVAICAGTSFVPGFSYTARPRSSYRGEDVLSLMKTIGTQHGIPAVWRFEQGVWKSNLVADAVKLMGSSLKTVYSPHQKPFIEGLFNTLWTKLSVHFPDAHVGRFQGEQKEANDLLVACRAGAKDPRKYFPMLSTVIAAMQEVIAEKNRTPVNTAHHGRWVPEERWESELARPLIEPASEWMFAPFVRKWKVKGNLVGGRVPVFEEMSVPFDFSAPWLTAYDGAEVKCHFDPRDPKCAAQVILMEKWNNQRAGTVLGPAMQVNDTAGYTRLVMGWGDDPTHAGAKARQQAAAAMRREVRAILPRSQRGSSASEERDGLGQVIKITSGSNVGSSEPNVESSNVVSSDAERQLRPSGEELTIRERQTDEFFEKNALDFL